jgi:hypothetical protein
LRFPAGIRLPKRNLGRSTDCAVPHSSCLFRPLPTTIGYGLATDCCLRSGPRVHIGQEAF